MKKRLYLSPVERDSSLGHRHMEHLLLIIIVFTTTIPPSSNSHSCAFHVTKLRGHIYTPNFPGNYPVPIHCQWVLEAPTGRKVAVYFTQFYMKHGFMASEYAYYSWHIRSGVGQHSFGLISATDEPTYLVSNQRILVLTLGVRTSDNVHLRVKDYLLEASGFNISYEMILKNETVRDDSCIYHHCSFTGFCYADERYDRFSCGCIDGYFGEECQYDDACGPHTKIQVCQNGGTCRYYIGSSVRTCECPPGFKGAKCEKLKPSLKNNVTNEKQRKCQDNLYPTTQGYISVYSKRDCTLNPPSLILRLEISEAMPLVEGLPLLIACTTFDDDSNTSVQWMRDTWPIEFSTTGGRLWNMEVPRDSMGLHTFLLGFENVTVLDAGLITCDARDGNRNDSLSIKIVVRPKFELLMDPLSATVKVGSSVYITCVSKDGVGDTSSYIWKKNDRELHRSRDEERTEDLYPVGTRLSLRSAGSSANYTCVMRTFGSIVQRTSVVTVVNSTGYSKMCAQEEGYGIRWKVTAIGATNVQPCPSGYTGYIRRKCESNETDRATWEAPDFSTCFSVHFLALRKELDSWKMGYRKKTLSSLLGDLHEFLSTRYNSMQNSEGEPVLDLLYDLQRDFHSEQKGTSPEGTTERNWNLLLNLTSFLFHSTLVTKAHESFKLHLLVRNISLAYGSSVSSKLQLHFRSQCLNVQMFKTTIGNAPKKFRIPWCDGEQCGHTSIEVELKHLRSHFLNNHFISVTFAIVLYRCLFLKDIDGSTTRKKSVPVPSHLFSVEVMNQESENLATDMTPKVKVLYQKDDNLEVVCSRLTYENRKLISHSCHDMDVSGNSSFCECLGSGLFSFSTRQALSHKYEGHYNSQLAVFAIATGLLFLFFLLVAVLKNIWELKTKIFLLL